MNTDTEQPSQWAVELYDRAFAEHFSSTKPALEIQRAFAEREAELVGETFTSIIQWGDETFGPCAQDRAIERAWEEWQEMISPGADVPIEAADVIIVLLRIPGIADAIQRKMAINRNRKWNFRGDGTGYHIPDAALKSREDGHG